MNACQKFISLLMIELVKRVKLFQREFEETDIYRHLED